MFAITEETRKIYEKEINTFAREIISANLLEIEAASFLSTSGTPKIQGNSQADT